MVWWFRRSRKEKGIEENRGTKEVKSQNLEGAVEKEEKGIHEIALAINELKNEYGEIEIARLATRYQIILPNGELSFDRSDLVFREFYNKNRVNQAYEQAHMKLLRECYRRVCENIFNNPNGEIPKKVAGRIDGLDGFRGLTHDEIDLFVKIFNEEYKHKK